MKRIVGMMTLAALVGFGSTPVAAQSFDAPDHTASALPVAGARAGDASPLFAKMIMPSSTDWSLRADALTTRGALPLLYASLIGLQAYDGFSTSRGLGKGAVESNALMASLVKHPVSLWGAKAGTTLASIYIAERLWKQHRRGAAIAMMVVSNAMMAGVAANNAKALRRLN